MRSTCLGLLTSLLILAAAPRASSVELAYRWAKGDQHKFHYEDESRMSLKMSGMGDMGGMAGMGGMGVELGAGLDVTVKTVTEFSLKVLKALPGGRAEVELTVDKLELFQGGARLPALGQIPPDARRVLATIDRKGRVSFHRMVTVYVKDDQVYLGIRKAEAGPGRAAASVSAGGPEGGVDVDLVASIDPRTGQVVASAKVRERPAKLRKVQIREQDPGVDIFPKQLFEMLLLPDGDMAPGSQVELQTPIAKLSVALAPLAGQTATLRYRTEAVAATPGIPADQLDEADEDADEDADEMPDLGAAMGMGAGGMGAAPGAGGMGAGDLKTQVDATLKFDLGHGRLLGITGTSQIQISMAGMGQMQTRSAFRLERKHHQE